MEIGFNRVNYIIETSTGAVESGLDQIGLDWMGLDWKDVTKRHQLGPWNLINESITCLNERLTYLLNLDWMGLDWKDVTKRHQFGPWNLTINVTKRQKSMKH